MKNTSLYEEVNDMTADTLFGLIFIVTAMFGLLIATAIDMGVFDIIAVKFCNYIVSRTEQNERKGI